MKNFTLSIKLMVFFFLIHCSCFSQSTATYDISLTTTWNASEHSSVPGNAHWSDLIGATHNTANEFVEIGENATLGIKNVAETGNNSAITTEINDAITAGSADQLLQDGFSPFAAISSAGFTDLNVDENFPLITLVSMVAPSPDWFIAINSLNLRNDLNTDWKDTFTIDVFTYDAGTDIGTDYTSDDSAISPVGVSMITGIPINGNKMATVTFTLKNVLSIDEESPFNSIRIYPNPVKDVLTIANFQNVDLKTIEIYNILGNLVVQVNTKDLSFNNNLQLNVSDLNEGLYLTKLIAKDDQSKTQKLIIH
jgi:hypothetical protein